MAADVELLSWRNVRIQAIEWSFQVGRFLLSDDEAGRMGPRLVAIMLFVIASMSLYRLHC
jgi:hypothetical protein